MHDENSMKQIEELSESSKYTQPSMHSATDQRSKQHLTELEIGYRGQFEKENALNKAHGGSTDSNTGKTELRLKP